MSTSGAATAPTLDGLHLQGAAADSWEVVETEQVGTIRMANGSVREQRLAPSPNSPVIRRWYTVTLGYLADGVLSEWDLPWPQAPHLLAPPSGAPPSRFTPTARLGWGTAPLTIQEPDSATYTSGTPSPGECWFEKTGQRFKLAAPPLSGTRLILQIVPLFAMVTAAEDLARQYRDWIREPRRIALVETEE